MILSILLDMIHNALFFATLKRRAGRTFWEKSCCFWVKIFNFYQKQQLLSDRFFAMSSSN